IKSFVGIMFMVFYLISGVLFPLWIIPEKYMHWVLWNPYAHIISNIRSSAFLYYPTINGVSVLYPSIVTIIVLFCALGLYKFRKERLLTQ
ncbi:MAG: ABC transporter permease, partial [Wohlfahrtiimonas sp.]